MGLPAGPPAPLGEPPQWGGKLPDPRAGAGGGPEGFVGAMFFWNLEVFGGGNDRVLSVFPVDVGRQERWSDRAQL